VDCEINPEFKQLYSDICNDIDYSSELRKLGDEFVSRTFDDDYIAVHLRFPDVMGGKSFKDHSGFSEEDVSIALDSFAQANGFDVSQLFIATNKPKLAKDSALGKYQYLESESAHASFIEQYICCKASYFLMSNFNDYSKIDEPHQRSTWSSFVADYRIYKMNKSNNLVLNNVVTEHITQTEAVQ